MDKAPFVSLPGSFDEYLERLGTKERHELRRKMRRAGEFLPGLAFRVTRTTDELANDLPSFLRLLRKSHPAKEAFMDEAMATFFREVAEGFLASGRLRLAFLSTQGWMTHPCSSSAPTARCSSITPGTTLRSARPTPGSSSSRAPSGRP